MEKAILLLLLSVCFSAKAQGPDSGAQTKPFHGKAEYFSKRIFKNGVAEVGVRPEDDEEIKKAYEAALKKASERVFTLDFNKKEALYEIQPQLEQPSPQANVSVGLVFSGLGKKYINIQDGTKITEDDILGKPFLIVEKTQPIAWKLLNESKKIGGYACYKAEVVFPVSEKEQAEYDSFLKEQETQTSLFPVKEPKEKKVTAWYTTDIPVSLGPEGYWGLPGLILELSDDEHIVLCSKVILSHKENYKIKVPDSGREVTQEEFDAIHKDKMDSIFRSKD